MKPKVDQNLCIACGTCQGLCPEVFKVEEKATVIEGVDYAQHEEKIKQAVDSCPVQAISIEE